MSDSSTPSTSPPNKEDGSSLERDNIARLLQRAVAELNTKEPVSQGAERRRNRRYPYRHIQLLAPYVNELPRRAEFFKVRCNNLSVGGFSYFWHEKPDYQYVVVGLGLEPDLSFLTAKILHVVPHNAEFLICCRFLGRLSGVS